MLGRIPRFQSSVEVLGPAHDFGPPEISYVIPVFNQEQIIRRNLSSLVLNARSTFELILIDDNSSDSTFTQVIDFLESPELRACKRWTKIIVVQFRRQYFETMCDHVGIMRSSAKYVIEIQADMDIVEDGFDLKLVRALQSDPQLFIVSGRGVMNFADIAYSYGKFGGSEASIGKSFVKALLRLLYHRLFKAFEYQISITDEVTIEPLPVTLVDEISHFYQTGEAGRLGRSIEHVPTYEQMAANILFIGETVMRGPIIFERSRYLELGGFNLKAFYLGFDEHDLIFRAATEKSWKAGYISIGFSAPMRDGSMRRKRSLGTKIRLARESRRVGRNMHLSTLSRFNTLYSSHGWSREVLRLGTLGKEGNCND